MSSRSAQKPAYKIYEEEMIKFRMGFPIWDPDSYLDDTRGIQIGDVGYFVEGSFTRIKSLRPIHQTLGKNENEVRYRRVRYQISSGLCTKDLRVKKRSKSTSILGVEASTSSSQAAALAIEDGYAMGCDVDQGTKKALGQLWRSNYRQWIDEAGLDKIAGKTELFLVTGVTSTYGHWEATVYSGLPETNGRAGGSDATFGLGSDFVPTNSDSWSRVSRRRYPSGDQTSPTPGLGIPSEDACCRGQSEQTLFVRGFWMKDRKVLHIRLESQREKIAGWSDNVSRWLSFGSRGSGPSTVAAPTASSSSGTIPDVNDHALLAATDLNSLYDDVARTVSQNEEDNAETIIVHDEDVIKQLNLVYESIMEEKSERLDGQPTDNMSTAESFLTWNHSSNPDRRPAKSIADSSYTALFDKDLAENLPSSETAYTVNRLAAPQIPVTVQEAFNNQPMSHAEPTSAGSAEVTAKHVQQHQLSTLKSLLNTKQHVLLASGALAHLDQCQDLLNETLFRHNLLENFDVMAGFDESFIEEGVGLLEMVYAVSDVEISDGEAICTSLGRIFSPYPGLIITPTMSYITPVFVSDADDAEWDIHALVQDRTKLFKESLSAPKDFLLGSSYNPDGSNSNFSLPVGRCSEQSGGNDENPNRGREEGTPNGNGPGRSKSHQDEPDGGGDDPQDSDQDSDDPDPDPGKVAELDLPRSATFKCPAKVYSGPIVDQREVQEFVTRGEIECQNEHFPSGRRNTHIKFTNLSTTCEQLPGSFYQQRVARVSVKLANKTWTKNLHPRSTLAHDVNVKETKARRKGWGVTGTAMGGWQGLHPNLSAALAVSYTSEETTSQARIRHDSRIILHEGTSYVDWIFHVDDCNQRQRGLDLDAESLPRILLRFRTKRPPAHLEFAIQSFWTFVPPESGRKLVRKRRPTPLANLLVWIEIKMPADLSRNTYLDPSCATMCEATTLPTSSDSEIKKNSGASLLSGVSDPQVPRATR